VLAIKPISAGGWKPGEKKTRNGWWYRPLEDQSDINLAIRFSLSLDPVVSVLPVAGVRLPMATVELSVPSDVLVMAYDSGTVPVTVPVPEDWANACWPKVNAAAITNPYLKSFILKYSLFRFVI